MGVFYRQDSSLKHQRGFTLIEVCIGLIIISLLAVPYMQMYQRYQLKTINEETANNLGAVKAALAKYATRYGRYPLPANPSLATGSATEGLEVAVGAVGTCTLASTNVCRATTPTWGVAGHNTVLIGAVPYATLGLPIKSSYDGYKDKFKYAVTEFMTTTPYTFSNDDGILLVVDRSGNDTDAQAKPVWSQCALENGTCSFTGTKQVVYGTDPDDAAQHAPILNLSTSTPCTNAVFTDPTPGLGKKCWFANLPKAHAKHFVVVSHGRDRKGAFTLDGIRTVACTSPTAPQSKDDVNCQNTATFNDNSASDSTGGTYTVAGSDHYDDSVISTATLEEGTWVQKTGQTDIYSNLPANGNILISPVLKYDAVTGDPIPPTARLQVEGGDIKADKLVINRFCPAAGCPTTSPVSPPSAIPAETFSPLSIAGTPDYNNVKKVGYGISCGNVTNDAGAMTGISSSDENCLDVFPAGFNMTGCASGKVAHGTDASGNLICSDF